MNYIANTFKKTFLNQLLSRFLFLLIPSMFSLPILASEGIFSYLYTAETTPAQNWEYEQKQTLRSGKARGSYAAFDLRNEFEYGVTDFLQAAFYLNSSYNKSSNLYDDEDVSKTLADQNEFNINGISVELMYRILSPFKDGIGLAVFVEPELSLRNHMNGTDRIERALETRIVLQKDFLGDQIITAANLMFEPEWEKTENGGYQKELWAEFTAGISYRFRANWFAGLEFRNHMEFTDMDLSKQEHSAYFLGPNVHYGAETYWWTLTVLPQIAGWPRDLGTGSDGKMISSSYAHLGQHEALEIRFAFGIPLEGEHHHHDEH